MKYFLDTEFKEKPNTIDLISIGIVSEDGREYYAICQDFLHKLQPIWRDEWIRNNVLLPIYMEYSITNSNKAIEFSKANFKSLLYGIAKPTGQIRNEIIDFIGDEIPEFYGYFADYDWVVFCWIFGRMIDLPSNFPQYCKDLRQMMADKNLDDQWKKKYCPDPEGIHNALEDAKWNYQLFKKIMNEP